MSYGQFFVLCMVILFATGHLTLSGLAVPAAIIAVLAVTGLALWCLYEAARAAPGAVHHTGAVIRELWLTVFGSGVTIGNRLIAVTLLVSGGYFVLLIVGAILITTLPNVFDPYYW